MAWLVVAAACAGAAGDVRDEPATAIAPLRASGRHFVDPGGRVVVLRGVNLSGDAKVPPFLPIAEPSALDPLPRLGVNLIRLVFIWEAFEPSPGRYDDAYLARMVSVAGSAWERGIYVMVDFHQDGFSRFASCGVGDGFPPWALSPRARPAAPDNGPASKDWPLCVATDVNTHRSFSDFYADSSGVRTRYLAMVARAAAAFATVPGVLGYDPINEPWGREVDELAPLYADAAAAIRAFHPSAILFLEGQASTNLGLQTKLPKPRFGNVAYAPHFYKAAAMYRTGWGGSTSGIDSSFDGMRAKAREWDVPLVLGEFGIKADAPGSGDYVAYILDRLDDAFSSGAQWNYTPGWDPVRKDGWNGEDFSILVPGRGLRANFRAHPYPRFVSGSPVAFRYVAADPAGGRPHSLAFTWDHRPELGETEVFLPMCLFSHRSVVTVDPPDAAVVRDEARQLLVCRLSRASTVTITVTGR